MTNNLKIALCQTDIVWENAAETIATIEKRIYSFCKENHPDLIVLPETFSVGFSMNPEVSEPSDGPSVSWLRRSAAACDAAIIASVPTLEGENRYNRCYFITPDGKEYHYDKRHLFNYSGEGATYCPGKEKCIVSYKGWNISLTVCYDLRFPVWSRNNGNAYDLLVNIANWPDSRINAARALIRARAIENCAYSLFCNRVGEDMFGTYSGGSVIYDYFGDEVGCEKNVDGVSIISAELSRKDIDHYRERFPAWKDADKFNIEI